MVHILLPNNRYLAVGSWIPIPACQGTSTCLLGVASVSGTRGVAQVPARTGTQGLALVTTRSGHGTSYCLLGAWHQLLSPPGMASVTARSGDGTICPLEAWQ